MISAEKRILKGKTNYQNMGIQLKTKINKFGVPALIFRLKKWGWKKKYNKRKGRKRGLLPFSIYIKKWKWQEEIELER